MPLQHPLGTEAGPTTPAGSTGSQRLRAMVETAVEERGWLNRLEAAIERYPWPTLLLALGVGYAIARRMR